MYLFTCKYCREEYEFKNPGQCGNHVLNCSKNIYKELRAQRRSQRQITLGITRREEKYLNNPKYCLNCNTQIFKYINTFCSQSCGAVYSNKNKINKCVNKDKTKETNCIICDIKGVVNIRCDVSKYRCIDCKKEHEIFKQKKYSCRYVCICVTCNSEFTSSGKHRKTCSNECFRKYASVYTSNHPNCGGKTNYKRYEYNNISMDSTWEVEIAKWFDENNINWIREKKIFFRWIDSTNKKRRYHPDFYLPNYGIYILIQKINI